ncbi:MAG: ankyrin repeat domain-containing protein [Rubripirellula sp.]|nr:ankyrin repeat domain-containing protein [Rubripirellula sp.]
MNSFSRCFSRIGGVVIAMFCCSTTALLAADKESDEAARKAVAGSWIRYNGAQFELKRFDNGKHIHERFDEYGVLRNRTSSNVELMPKSDLIEFELTEMRQEYPASSWKRNWSGMVDELAIWNRPLSDREVDTLWNEGAGLSVAGHRKDGFAKGLIGAWPFDGNLNDSSGQGRDGVAPVPPTFEKGKVGSGIGLDGDQQYVTLGGKAKDYEPASGAISLSLWFRADELDTVWQTLISKGQWRNWRIHRHQRTGTISSAGVNLLQNPVVIDDGKLHHLVAVMESGKQAALYVDNEKVMESSTNNLAANGNLPTVGADMMNMVFKAAYDTTGDELVTVRTNTEGEVNRSRAFRKVTNPQEALLIAARNGDLEAVKQAIADGAELDGTSPNSYTAFGYAVGGGHRDIMDYLHEKGAEIDKATRFNKTPLMLAVGAGQGEIATWLIQQGADIDTRLEHGGNLVHEAVFWRQPEMLELVIKHGADVNAVTKDQGSGLHWTAGRLNPVDSKENHKVIECIKILVASGADKTLKDGNGETSASHAAEKGFDQAAKMMQ